jgi:hypothetical protein
VYLDIFKEKSIEENFSSLRAYVIILALIIMVVIIISEFTDISFQGTMKAITMMMGFWLFCAAFQHQLQKISYPRRLIIFLLLGAIQWLGIFIYFTEGY